MASTDMKHPFFRQCLMDEASSVVQSLKCPSCDVHVGAAGSGAAASSSSSIPEIYVEYLNEGGLQSNLPLWASLNEEAYVQEHPEALPARAFSVMCAEGDIDGLIELLIHADSEVADIGSIVRYQDPLSSMTSGLHLAVEGGHEGAIWLLLWLSSTLTEHQFPSQVHDTASAMGLGRLPTTAEQDVRRLRNTSGQTAAMLALDLGQLSKVLDITLLEA